MGKSKNPRKRKDPNTEQDPVDEQNLERRTEEKAEPTAVAATPPLPKREPQSPLRHPPPVLVQLFEGVRRVAGVLIDIADAAAAEINKTFRRV